MKIKEKMEVFRKFTIELASKESEASLRDFQSSCDRKMEAFRRNRQAEMEHSYQVEEAKIRREANHEISRELLRQKRSVDNCKKEWKARLFGRVREMLAEYQKAEAYQEYLAAKIGMAKELAGEEDLIIYINPSDADKKEALEAAAGVSLTVSAIDFGGGIRAVIRARNILIDESFVTKLEQEEASL